MKVLFVTHYSQNGGANNELLWLASELKKRGYNVYVALPKSGAFEERLKAAGIQYQIFGYRRWITTIPQKKNPISRIWEEIRIYANNRNKANEIASYAKENGIEIIHTNDSLTVVGCKAASIAGIAHVWHLREFLEEDYSRTIVFSERYIQKWFAKSDRIICISDAIKAKYQSRFVRDNWCKIYDGIIIPQCHWINSKKQIGDTMRLLFLGGTNEGKGFSDLIKITGVLKKRYGIPVQVSVAGNCSRKGEYKRIIQECGVEDSFVFLGFVTDVNKLFQQTDIFLMLSRLEAFGLVTVEAMLGGAVVVGNNCGGTKEIIRHGSTGFLYEEANIDSAAELIKKIWDGEFDLDRIRQQAFEYAKSNFCIEKTAECIEQEYKNILSERASS
ncbi:hypothetical protein B5G28_08440 [Faecalibacterium sp. An77]|uniref:glycosyltransferase family 4 protein n=1 Tax=Faecalibacterium sp. An77 TaxID=1965655 RepID=UPI000B38F170|nr:glycosyltransferase family 4 protein [Faecalibacterium sp. An77]OUN38710.1 hypothetical protein B5G28_08440 [Faecalibacterium sp. An77]